MDKRLKKFSIIGLFVIFGLAAFWHFLFELLPTRLIAVISPVNESVWEHMKLFYFPALIWYVVTYAAAGKHYPNFAFSHALALIVMPVAALILHYAWTLVFPESAIADIVFTFIAIAIGSYIAYKLTKSGLTLGRPVFYYVSMLIVIGLWMAYAVFTFNPPNHPLFQSS